MFPPDSKGNEAMTNTGTAPPSTIFVAYGATGDLARRLVLPAFYRLAIAGLLPEEWRLIADGRGEATDEDFQEEVRKSLQEFGPRPSEGPWDAVRGRFLFAGGGFRPDDPGRLLDVIARAKEEMGGSPQLIHYMAVPPSAFGPLTEAIGAHGLATGARVVYEKPFGTSLESFRELDRIAHETFEESQIYRIDHFLGKEATQDIHVLRFANGLFAGAWNSSHIDSVQIDVPETLDVAMRAHFYDDTGAILDMLVTHLFQVAGELAMEPPHCLEPDCLAEAREAVIGSFRPLSASDVVVGQYDGYRDAPRPTLPPECGSTTNAGMECLSSYVLASASLRADSESAWSSRTQFPGYRVNRAAEASWVSSCPGMAKSIWDLSSSNQGPR
jgi:glucose-6-phosphate 1-dehydrogenase